MSKQNSRIRDVKFETKADFRRWRWKLIRLYLGRLFTLLITPRREHIYAAFLMEIQRCDNFSNLNEQFQKKIFKA